MAGIQKIRDKSSGLTSKIIAGTIIVTFALFFGWGTVFTGSDVNNIAKVNGINIDVIDLNFEERTQQFYYNQRFGDQSVELEPEILRSLSVSSLIRRELVLQYLNGLKIEVPESIAYAEFINDDAYQLDGKFSQDRFESVLRSLGFTANDYLKRVSRDMTLDFWRKGILHSEFSTSQEIINFLELANQTRDVSFINFKLDNFKVGIEPTYEQTKEYYTLNESKFSTDDQAKIKYLEFSKKTIEDSLIISEEEIINEYNFYLENFSRKPLRSASHIMVSISSQRTKDEAIELTNNIRSKLSTENFKELVSEYSEDKGSITNGGDLGVSSGEAFPQEFEDVLINMEVGDISGPVILDNSIHLLHLTDYKEPQPNSLEEIKDSFASRLKSSQALTRYLDSLDRASDILYDSNDLAALGEQLDMEVLETSFFSASVPPVFLTADSLNNLIFTETPLEGLSDIVESNQDKAYIFEVVNRIPSTIRPFEEVDKLVNTFLVEALAIKEISNIRKKVSSNISEQNLENTSIEFNVPLQTYKSVSRDSSLLPSKVLMDLFQIQRGDDLNKIYLSSQKNGDLFLLALDGINAKTQKYSSDQEEYIQFKELLEVERANRLLANSQNYLETKADITYLESKGD